jgi:hypothetical protein
MMLERTRKQRNGGSFEVGCDGRERGWRGLCSGIVMYLALMGLAVVAVPSRFVDRTRSWVGAVLQVYCFYLAKEPFEAGTYFGLPSVPDGMPIGVLVLLAAFVIMRRAFAHCDARC